MNRPFLWRKALPSILFWIVSGVFILCGINVTHCFLTDMPLSATSLMVSALFGILAGSLFGAGDVRLHLLTDQVRGEEHAGQPVSNDPLTGLPNRALLDDRLMHAIAQAHRDSRHLGVFFFDLDHFKTINDTQGHAVGDLILRSVAQRLKKFIREGDTFARLGGDEFVIVQADPKHDPNFSMLARRILETLREPFSFADRELHTTASIGIAIYPVDGENPDSLLKSADTAMYVAKSRGRNNFQFFSSEMNAEALRLEEMEQYIRMALEQNALTLHYQPQGDLPTGRIVAVKALLRYRQPPGVEISPGEFARIAEASGQIYALTRWTIETAVTQAMAWQAAGLPAVRLAVNLSTHCLRQGEFAEELDQILRRTGMAPELLELELPEPTVMQHLQEVLPALTDLKVRGVKLAIDKFGTGSSSILYLTHLPVKRLKIARDFIVGLPRNGDHAVITEAIIAMARCLGMKVTAVGVETEEQLEFLSRLGCSEVAGNYLSPPLPADQIPALFATIPGKLASGALDRGSLRFKG